MNTALSNTLAIFFQVLGVVVPLAGLVVVAFRVRGTARALGVAGAGLFVLVQLLHIVSTWVLLPLVRRSGGFTAIGVVGAGQAVLSLLAIVLLVAAVCVGRPPRDPAAPPPPGPYGSFSPPPSP